MKLRKCPCCNGKAKLKDKYLGITIYWILCNTCKISTDTCDTPEEAVAVWNRRVVVDAVREHAAMADGWEDGETFYKNAISQIRKIVGKGE